MYQVLRLRGGGDHFTNRHASRLGIAPGGLIKQDIRKDHQNSSCWLRDLVIPISVHILNSADHSCVTGKNPPPSPIDAQTYVDTGLPFFDLFEQEEIDVAGTDAFTTLKSVNKMQKARGELKAEDPTVHPHTIQLFSLGNYVWTDGEVITTADPHGLLDPAGPRRAFRTLADLEQGVRGLTLGRKKV